MKPTQVALYARVSSDQQSEAKTIESQLADLRARIASTGSTLSAELEFLDDGYSGATLIRPALERLRDVAAAGGIDQLYGIVLIGWHATTPIKSSYSKSSFGQAWR